MLYIAIHFVSLLAKPFISNFVTGKVRAKLGDKFDGFPLVNFLFLSIIILISRTYDVFVGQLVSFSGYQDFIRRRTMAHIEAVVTGTCKTQNWGFPE